MGILTCTAAFLWATWMMKKDSTSSSAEVCMQISFYLFKCLSGAIFTLMYLYSAEVYPTIARGTGSALCIGFGRLGAICSPPLFEWLDYVTGSYHAFFYFMMVLAVVTSALVFFLPF